MSTPELSETSAEENLRILLMSQLERMSTLIDTQGSKWSSIQVSIKLSLLERYYGKFDQCQTTLDKYGDVNSFERRNNFDDLYSSIKERLLSLQSEKEVIPLIRASPMSEVLTASSRPRSMLPRITLPKFDGNYSKWAEFIDVFRTLIDNDPGLSDAEKFQTLRSCLVGDASSVIQSMECTERNYKMALELLTQRFDNKRLIFGSHIKNIINLEPVGRGSVHQLRTLLDHVTAELRALQSLGSKEQIAEAILISTIMAKLDTTTRTRWEEYIDLQEVPSWDYFAEFLRKRCQTMEHIDSLREPSSSSAIPMRKRDVRGRLVACPAINSRGRPIACTAINSRDNRCQACQAIGHTIYKCSKYLDLLPKERYKLIKRLRLCINCLKGGHTTKECKSSLCVKCAQGHHTSLHFDLADSKETLSSQRESRQREAELHSKETATSNPTCLSTLTSEHSFNNDIIIATAVVNVRSSCGIETTARILLDSASQVHFITRRLAHQLRLKEVRCQTTISGIGSVETNAANRTNITIMSRQNSFKIDLEALVLSNITANQPSNFLDIRNWSIPGNISLADPQFNTPGRIDILLGAEVFMKLLCIGQISLGTEGPCLQKTVFGWVVSGALKTITKAKQSSTSLTASTNNGYAESKDSLSREVRRFWEVEEVTTPVTRLTPEEQTCEEIFTATTFRDPCGRFVVHLPLKDDPTTLGDSYNTAFRRLLNLKHKLNGNSELSQAYHQFMKDYQDLGHMERIQNSDTTRKIHFIPHHGVEQMSGSRKKLRVVFDASCKTSSGRSLNDILMTGPALQGDLFSLLCRFRQHRFVITADMVKMYRQILVHPDHTHLQMIIWQNNDNEDINLFELKTVTYGTSCAPFLDNRCIKELASIYESEFPAACRVLNRDTYVDDILTGANTEADLKEIQDELIEVLNKAGMSLHKWCSNSRVILQATDQTKRSQLFITGTDESVKTLGMIWQPSTDSFTYHLKAQARKNKVTKRSVLSIIASLFDPLGLINPILVSAKILMQEIWKLGTNWDESLPIAIHNKWNNFVQNLDEIKNIRINRFVAFAPNSEVQFHGFADASQLAYGGCIFIRVSSPSGTVVTNLLCAKSRVGPVKTQTLPRLELCAAVLLVELMDKVIEEMNINSSAVYCWTDSSITLSWIAGSPSTWTTFVAHRVANIQSKSAVHSIIWRHVRTKENPADILSRGAHPQQLISNRLWFHGPGFLSQSAAEWPHLLHLTPISLERKKEKPVCLIIGKEDVFSKMKFLNSYRKTIRIMAYIQRFVDLCRKSRTLTTTEISVDELRNGELGLIRMIQRNHYAEEIASLQQGKPVPKRSKILHLHPFLDAESTLRVGGRLHNSDLAFTTKHPLLLPRTHYFTKSLVKYMHEKHLHAGCLTLHNIIRQRYWIPNARQLIRSIVHQCIRCFRSKPRTLQQLMGNLPAERVTPSHPFANVGIDYCGPFKLKPFVRSKIELKAYLSLFICLTSKAVHIELVSSLSTEAFIAALKRFVGRRGLCTSITSDNATNFVGASRQLDELKSLFLSEEHNQLVSEYCNSEGIRWQFIPPRSPHFGGLWEASVKKAKYLLARILTHERLNHEEFTTVVVQVESMLNSRPLTAISEDPNDLEALTPGHFLIGREMQAPPEPGVSDVHLSRLSRWQHISRLQQLFWERWTKEYLHDLQGRSKWRTEETNIKEGSLVIIKEDNMPPNTWALGRVTKVIPGKDGFIRVAEVRTTRGIYTRPISKLCPLPTPDNVANSETQSNQLQSKEL